MSDPGHCDLCNRELNLGEMVYTYFTPCTATLEEAQANPDDPTKFWAEDPEWAACTDCHDYVRMLDIGRYSRVDWTVMMAQRSLRNQQVLVGGASQQIEHIVSVLVGFVRHKGPMFTVEVNEGRGK